MMMSRDLSPPVTLVLNGKPLRLHLDMGAMWDFEEQMKIRRREYMAWAVQQGIAPTDPLFEDPGGTTVGDVLRPIIKGLGGEDFSVFGDKKLSRAQKAKSGMQMLDTILDMGVLDAHTLLPLMWAMAGGEKTGLSVRDFGPVVSWGNREALLTAFGEALRNGFPPADEDEDEDAPAAAPAADDDEDPTPRPES